MKIVSLNKNNICIIKFMIFYNNFALVDMFKILNLNVFKNIK